MAVAPKIVIPVELVMPTPAPEPTPFETCPKPGDVVLYTLPDDFEGKTGLTYHLGSPRQFPAMVEYQTNAGEHALDLSVLVIGKWYRYGWVYEGTKPGTWQVRS